MLDTIAKLFNETPEDASLGISYIDPELRLQVSDIRSQLAWYRALVSTQEYGLRFEARLAGREHRDEQIARREIGGPGVE